MTYNTLFVYFTAHTHKWFNYTFKSNFAYQENQNFYTGKKYGATAIKGKAF